MQSLVPVILSGGSGTRLWPVSRESRPKQFLPLVTARSLFQETLLRAQRLSGAAAPLIVCNEAHRFAVAEQVRELGATAQAIVLEPAGRSTAPAAAVAALLAQHPARGSAGEPLLLVLPADHVVSNAAAFIGAAETAVEAALAGYLVTFGVPPDRPETGYGYILRGANRGRWSLLERFVEKPDHATARTYVDSGEYLWNSGMFVFSARAYLSELGRHAPAVLGACEQAVAEALVDPDFTRLGMAFAACPSDSIDYAVMEKTDKAAVVPLDAGWSDVGSWAALHDVLEKDEHGSVIRGDVVAEGCRDSYIESNDRLVAAVGLDGVIVVETADAVLVAARGDAQNVKRVVDRLKAEKRVEHREIAPRTAGKA
jgi:mannose-1-phosphate guanylyltransferase/mannose-6-phosphate isomerase